MIFSSHHLFPLYFHVFLNSIYEGNKFFRNGNLNVGNGSIMIYGALLDVVPWGYYFFPVWAGRER